jgi:peptide deformylase
MLEIVYYPDPILRRPTDPVEEVDDEVREMVPAMIEAMHRVRGLGLAANQIGWSKRLAVVSGSGEPGDERVVINPELVSEEGGIAMEEGCLSFPGLTGMITRPELIEVRYTDLEGETVTEKADGLLARCLLHEIDHLDGVLFISKMTPADRIRLKRSIRELEEQYAASR